MKVVYVAGPYTGSSQWWLRLLRRLLLLPSEEELNVRRAMEYATQLRDAGFAVVLPHLSHYWDKRHRAPYKVWIDMDLAFIPRCDVMLRTPGKSSGASREVLRSRAVSVPVFFSVEEIIAWRDRPRAA